VRGMINAAKVQEKPMETMTNLELQAMQIL
jgi:hypothetical protein